MPAWELPNRSGKPILNSPRRRLRRMMSVIENRLSCCLYLNAISTILSKLPNRPRLAQNDGPICGGAAGRSSTQIRLTAAIDPAKLGTSKQARATDSRSDLLHASGSLTPLGCSKPSARRYRRHDVHSENRTPYPRLRRMEESFRR